MPLLTVTNLLTSQIQLQDPTGVSTFSETLAPSQTKQWAVATATAEALEPGLIQSAALARITFAFAPNPASPAEGAVGTPPTYTMATRPALTLANVGFEIFVSDDGLDGRTQTWNGTTWVNGEGVAT
jgi:hypothetical protein